MFIIQVLFEREQRWLLFLFRKTGSGMYNFSLYSFGLYM